MLRLDRMVQRCSIVRLMRTIAGDTAARPTTPIARRDAPSVVDGVELVDRILAEFKTFIGEMRCVGTERLLKAGVSMSHLHVMGILSRHGDTPMSKLADLLDVSMSNATGLVDRMEERGFVERVRVPDDRRVVLVRLTDRGRATLDEADVVRRDLIGRVLRRLEAPQLRRLEASLADVHIAVAGLLAEEGQEIFAAAHPLWHTHGRAVEQSHGPEHSHATEPGPSAVTAADDHDHDHDHDGSTRSTTGSTTDHSPAT
jgi:DNA-binding MarR family transcriptional regulator